MIVSRASLVALAIATVGCSPTVADTSTGAPDAGLLGVVNAPVGKLDLLLVIDDSEAMGPAQQILAVAIPDMIAQLANPACIDAASGNPTAQAPSGPTDTCPAGSARAYNPVLDMHVGVITSSLGSFGASACPDVPPPQCPSSTVTPNNDHGHLVSRGDVCGTTQVPTYQGRGFLAWDPAQQLSPPGIAEIGSVTGGTGLVGALHDILAGIGTQGCVVASQNEAWYRFLVDPDPYANIELTTGSQVVTSGTDDTLLTQRQQFLRPDSLLLIVNVTGQPDSSIKEFSSYPLAEEAGIVFPRGSSACTAKGPLDPCCYSCGEVAPKGCMPDPVCAANPTNPTFNPKLFRFGLMQWKATTGIEFFYQPSRYVAALTQETVANSAGTFVPNPIYTNLDPTNDTRAVRDPSLVFYATITGVPWQLLARQRDGTPDLVNGVDAIDPTQVGGFKSALELGQEDAKGNVLWDDIAGNPESYVAPVSPFMQEATAPRTGVDPITGVAIGSPQAFNGGERVIGSPANDIEYACIFPLITPIDESASAGDCAGAHADNPLCSPNPNDGMRATLQTSAKAYPGTKHLAIARGLSAQGIAASICPAQMNDPTSPDFGYRPALGAATARLRLEARGQCLRNAMTPDAAGQVACVVLVGKRENGACTCDSSAGQSPVTAAHEGLVVTAQTTTAGQGIGCFCELDQLFGASLEECRAPGPAPPTGWCYVDASQGPAAEALLMNCPSGQPQELRLTGSASATGPLFISCQGQ